MTHSPGRAGTGLGALAALVVLVGALAPASAKHRGGDGWTAPEAILKKDHRTTAVQIGAFEDGSRIATWQRDPAEAQPDGSSADRPAIQVAVRPAGARRFGDPETLRRGTGQPHLATSLDGEALLGWQRGDRAEAAIGTPDGTFADPQVLAPNDASSPQVAIGNDGTAVAAWEREDAGTTAIEGSVREPGGSFGPPITLAAEGKAPRVAVNSGGASVVSWEDTGRRDEPAQARVRPPGGDFGPDEKIPRSRFSNAGLELAIADDGTVFVLVNGREFELLVKASVREPGGSFSPARRISKRHERADFADLAVDAEGHAMAIWSRFDEGGVNGPAGVQATRYSAGTGWDKPELISGERAGGEQALAVNPSGRAVALFNKLSGDDVLQAAPFRPNRGWSDVERVAGNLGRRKVVSPDVALDAEGQATAVWGLPRTPSDKGVFSSDRPR